MPYIPGHRRRRVGRSGVDREDLGWGAALCAKIRLRRRTRRRRVERMLSG